MAVLVLSGALPFASAAQQAGSRLQTPSKASVIAPPSQRLLPGQSFDFILRFDLPPHGYDAGSRILCKFLLVSPKLSEAQPDGNQRESSQWTDLVNDDATYPLTLPVTHFMLPGTWRLTEVTVVGGAQHPIPVQENVTFEVGEPPPPRASVIWDRSQILEDGERFDFELRLETVPQGYDAGEIHFRFEMIKPDSQKGQPSPDGYLSVYEGRAPLINGQSTYKLSVPLPLAAIPQVGPFSIGKWKLVEVTLGQLVQMPVLIQDDVTFEVHAPVIVLHVQAPESVRAGQLFAFKVSVDRYPKDRYCLPTLSVVFSQRSPSGQPGANFHLEAGPLQLVPGQPSYGISVPLASDLPGGPWQGELRLAPPLMHMSLQGLCRPLDFEGDRRFEFNVEPAADLVTPTSVAVTVNPSQIQLLRAEADKLRAKAALLEQKLGSEDPAANRVLLQKSLQEALADLDKTEETYKKQGWDRASARAVNTFFDDIRFDYGEALKALADHSARGAQAGPRLEIVSEALGGPSPRLNPASQAVLASILHNAKAYDVVASSSSMTFNLEVFSEPEGATVSYRLRGGESHALDHETDWRIENLPRAVYLITFRKEGYEPKEDVPFDAINSTSPSILVRLERKHGAR